MSFALQSYLLVAAVIMLGGALVIFAAEEHFIGRKTKEIRNAENAEEKSM